jgi:glutamyl-tRNA reductase
VVVESLRDAVRQIPLEEAALLSTCNRTEIYAAGDVSDEQLLEWLAANRQLRLETLQDCYYCHRGLKALRHLMQVASGLDSLVLGEPQIFGQIKSAYAVGREAGTVSSQLNQAFQHAFTAAKRVRSETAIGQNPVSVAYASVSLAEQIFSELQSVHALLIGAGETIELVARHLKEKNIGHITVANRTLSRAQNVIGDFASQAILLSEIPEHLHRADIVISSTASQLPILGKGAVESALKQRRHKPMFMVDIAVPRDIEPQVEELADVYLYTVDDLKDVVQDNLRARQSAADTANGIIDQEIANWSRQQRALTAVDTIRAFRMSVEGMRDAEVEKALTALKRGQDSEQVINTLARNLTNKLMHKPTARLKRAGEEGRDDTIHATHDLFGLSKAK